MLGYQSGRRPQWRNESTYENCINWFACIAPGREDAEPGMPWGMPENSGSEDLMNSLNSLLIAVRRVAGTGLFLLPALLSLFWVGPATATDFLFDWTTVGGWPSGTTGPRVYTNVNSSGY